jgi:hypothetical protein
MAGRIKSLREIAAIALLGLAAATSAQDYPGAQSMRGMRSLEGHSAPMDAFKPNLNCAHKNECIVLVNNSTDYYVVGFYIDDEGTDKKGRLKWSDNLFRPDFTLRYHEAWWTHRSTKLGCLILAKVEMRERKSRKRWESAFNKFDLCKDGIPYTIIALNTPPKE